MNGGSPHVPGRTLVSRRGQGATRNLPILGAASCRPRTAGSSIHLSRTQNESSRGLSRPPGIHLIFALGLSNEVGPPHFVDCSCMGIELIGLLMERWLYRYAQCIPTSQEWHRHIVIVHG